jgi:hypothetical protein
VSLNPMPTIKPPPITDPTARGAGAQVEPVKVYRAFGA